MAPIVKFEMTNSFFTNGSRAPMLDRSAMHTTYPTKIVAITTQR